MSQVPRAEKLKVETLEDRTTPSGVKLPDPSTYAAGQVLFSIAGGADRNQTLTALAASPWGLTAKELGFGVFKLTLEPGVTVQQAMDGLSGNGWLGFVEPDYKIVVDRLPNDPMVASGEQWGVHNYGQDGGTAGADIGGAIGWNQARGTGQTIVAVFDDGIDYTHPDLAANVWTNTGETPGDGIDNDGNGFVDDVHGYNFADGNGDTAPAPGDEHGTHVAGTIGAVGDNGIGVSGVAWKTRLMAIKIFGGPTDALSAAIAGTSYAVNNGAKLLNNSWRYYGPISAGYAAAMYGARAKGAIMVASAGNDALNNDVVERYPSNFTRLYDNAIAVAALDRNDQLATFSNYGSQLVTLGAPGVSIWSTVPGGYDSLDGTSMATPHAAGVLAVVWDAFPNLTYRELLDLMKRSVDPVSALGGITVTGGRINLANMLRNATFGGYAVGADAGGGPVVSVFAPDGSQRTSFFAYDNRFQGGVRIAMADVNGDRVPDIITVPGSGGGPNVRVFDGRDQQLLYSFQAYSPSFTAGLYVAAGDLDGDGVAEIVTGAGEGGGPNVRVYKLGADRAVTLLNSFYSYSAGFTGGVRVAVGDFDNNGLVDIVTSPGFGGGPHIRVFDGLAAAVGQTVVLKEFMAGDPRANVGAYVAVGNMNGDGVGDIIVGSGAGNREVRVYDGRSLAFMSGFNVFQPGQSAPRVTGTTPPVGELLGNVGSPDQLPEDTAVRTAAAATRPFAGMRVAVLDLDRDGVDDIIAAGGSGDQSFVRVRNGRSMTTLGSDRTVFGNSFRGGVFVAASR